MLQVSELFVYPIKSLGGVSLTSCIVTDRGFQYDRRWMLVNEKNEFMTQRNLPEMALLKVTINEFGLRIFNKKTLSELQIPFENSGDTIMVQIWDNHCKAVLVDNKVNEWFSDALSTPCKFVYMPDSTQRHVEGRYPTNGEITSFSDAYPFLIIGQASIDDLNMRLVDPLHVDRFRPNIVFTGGSAFDEDTWAKFSVSSINFFGDKLCSRCVVTTIDQQTAFKSKEPLKTLASYRQLNNKIYFGQNLLHKGEGIVSVGDAITIEEHKASKMSDNHFKSVI